MKNINKLFTLALIIGTVASPLFVSASTTDDLLDQINALRSTVTALQQRVGVQGVTQYQNNYVQNTADTSACVYITNFLHLGSRDAQTNNEVSALQRFLTKQEYYSDEISGYFGNATNASLKSWQDKMGIVSNGSIYTTGYGATGPITRSKIKDVSCGQNNFSQVNTGTSIVVMSPGNGSAFVAGSFIPVTFSTVGLVGKTIQFVLKNIDTNATYALNTFVVGSDGVQTINQPITYGIPSGSRYSLTLSSVACDPGLSLCSPTVATSNGYFAINFSVNDISPRVTRIITSSNNSQIKLGEKFQIIGTNFTAPHNVYIGNKTAIITDEAVALPNGEMSLSVIAPNDTVPGQNYLTVRNVNGTSNQLSVMVGSDMSVGSFVKITSAKQASPLYSTVTGTATNVKQVRLVINNSSKMVYGGGLTPVVDGNWSVNVTPALVPGEYTIYVYDENSKQLLVNPLKVVTPVLTESPITVLSQNSQETWVTGTSQIIRWSTKNISSYANMSIALVDNAGGEHYVSGSTNTSSAVQNSGVVSVIVPSNLQAGQYRVVIKTTVGNQNYVAQSNSYVTIVGFQNQVSSLVISPNGGETVDIAKPMSVVIKVPSDASSLRYYIRLVNEATSKTYSLDETLGTSGISFTNSQIALGSQTLLFNIPSNYNVASGDRYKIEVCSQRGCEKSSGYFKVISSYSQGGVTSYTNGMQAPYISSLSKTTVNSGDLIDIYGNGLYQYGSNLIVNIGGINAEVLSSNSSNSIRVRVPQSLNSGVYNIQIFGSAYGASNVYPIQVITQNALFSNIIVTTPYGGATLIKGSNTNISWTDRGVIDVTNLSVKVELVRNGTVLGTIGGQSFAYGSSGVYGNNHLWDVNNYISYSGWGNIIESGSGYLIRVSYTKNGAVVATGDSGQFSISNSPYNY